MNVLLLSEDSLKSNSSLNDNCFGKNILPAIKTSQDIELQEIIGTCLYKSLCNKVEDGSISDSENIQYKFLLDEYVQPYLTYITLAHLVQEMSTKLANFGLVESNDEHLINLSLEERDLVKSQWTYYADSYCKRMQEYLKANRELFPELNSCECGGVKPCLDSAASINLFLGGFRSRRLIKGTNCC